MKFHLDCFFSGLTVGNLSRQTAFHSAILLLVIHNSWGTKERFWLTLAPENNTAKLYMVEKVIIWGI